MNVLILVYRSEATTLGAGESVTACRLYLLVKYDEKLFESICTVKEPKN